MTRRHFVMLADAMRECRPSTAPTSPEWQQWAQCVRCLTAALARTNPRFDRARFIAYCEA